MIGPMGSSCRGSPSSLHQIVRGGITREQTANARRIFSGMKCPDSAESSRLSSVNGVSRRCREGGGMSIFYTAAGGRFALPPSESANTAGGQALSPHSGQTPLVLAVRSWEEP